MHNPVIAGYVRSPFHFAHKGALVEKRPDDLAAEVVRALIAETGVDPSEIEDLIMGCAFPEGEQGFNLARIVGLVADLPISVAGATVNRFCGSSMQAIHMAAGAIRMDAGEAFICAGVESMSRIPMGGFNPAPNPDLYERNEGAYMAMGDTAENLARKYQITREEQEELAVASHARATRAWEDGKFAGEVIAVETGDGPVARDGCIRPGTSAEILAGLDPAFDAEGTVTAGTSSPLTDGAAAVLVCTEDFAARNDLAVLARIRSIAVAGCAPEIMGYGPVVSSEKALARAGLKMADIDVDRAQRGVRGAGAGLRAGAVDRPGAHEHRRRGDRHRPPARRHRRAHHRQGGAAPAPRGQALRAGDPVHRRRAGDLHRARGRLMAIRKAAVIGAGLMGGGIAAHIASCGHEVALLDIVPEGEGGRNALAEGAIARMLKADPAPFMDRADARRIAAGNIEDHLDLLADADWIVEAVVEKVEIKQDVYRRIDAARKAGSIVSSNTSTIPWRALVAGMPDAFARDFLITHFFNPPRYMRLLEVAAGPATRADAVAAVADFADRTLGKSVVRCNDTPGFIANRIGTFWISAAIEAALEDGVTVEEADALMGRPIGAPRTGVFGLVDLVGLDLMPLVGRSLRDALPADDPLREVHGEPEILGRMIDDGYTGRKGKGGFYRLDPDSEKREKQVVDLATGEYAAARRPRLDSIEQAGRSLRALLEFPDRTGAYAWRVMSGTLAYAAGLVPEIAGDVEAVDRAMRLGYNWKRGPFELIDDVGAGWFADRLAAEGRAVPPLLRAAAEAGGFYRVADGRGERLGADGGYARIARPPGVLLLSDVKRALPPLARNGSASLWDIGDGVACLEFHAKMNALDPEIMALIERSVEIVGGGMKALVIHNEGSNFSVGMNLGLALFAVNVGAWPMIEETVKRGQDAFNALKFAPFPVVGAPSGMALGGGCEVLLHCDAVQAHAESYIGLVESGVGIVPGWGGCKEMMLRGLASKRRAGGPMMAISRVFETVGLAKVSRSAREARKLGFLREGDGITANRERLLADAKAKALALAEDYAPPEPATLRLPGKTGRIALKMAVKGLARTGKASAHDLVVVDRLGTVLTGGDTDATRDIAEARLSELEREAILALIRMPATIARIEHMLETGKPLRN